MGFFLDEQAAPTSEGFYIDEEPSPTLGSESKAVARRGIEGVADLASFGEMLNPITSLANQFGIGPRDIAAKLTGAPRVQEPAEQIKDAATAAGLPPTDAQTVPGKIAGEVAYYAPSIFTPGGFTKAAATRALLGGAAAGGAKAADLSEGAQATAGLFGSLSPDLGKVAKAIVPKKAAEAIGEAGRAMLRKSLGTRASDYAKSAKELRLPEVTADGEVESLLKKTLDNVLQNDELGTSADPAKLLREGLAREKSAVDAIGQAVDAAQETQKRAIKPQFTEALSYVNRGKVPAQEAQNYRDEIKALQDAIASEGKGDIKYIQQQKVTAGSRYEEGNDIKNGFFKALYRDLKKTVERNVPGVRELNREEQKWKLVNPILRRNAGAGEAASLDQKALQNIRTSGGAGALIVPSLLGLTTGSVFGPVAGLGAAGALLAARSGKGRMAVGKAVRDFGDDAARAVMPNLVPGGAARIVAPQGGPNLKIQPESKEPEPMAMQSDTDPEMDMLVQAVIAQESGGKADAVSNVGAQGLMQVMPETAKEIAAELGVKEYDLKDPQTNVLFGSHYLKKLLGQFGGDIELALTAYHSGSGRVKKLLTRAKGSTLADIRKYLGPIGQRYASEVIARMGNNKGTRRA